MAFAGERVVKTGTYLYANEIVCDVCIVYSPVRYGTGDHADDDEYGIDQDIDSFYVDFGGTERRGAFVSRSGCFPSMAEAIGYVERTVEGVTWLD